MQPSQVRDPSTPCSPGTASSPSPGTGKPRRRRRIAAAVLLLAMLTPVLAGCLRVQVSMGVSSNDRVSGQIVAAAVRTGPGDEGPQLTAPDSLQGKVRIEPYDLDGYVGSHAYFDDLSFGEVPQLAHLSDQTQGMFDLKFSRSGDMVELSGHVDLQSVPPHGSDVQFSVAFPTRVAKTNGTQDNDNTVTWRFPPGEKSTVRAEVKYNDPNTRSFAGWAGIAGGVTLAVAALVTGLAYLDRNPPAPGAPAPVNPADLLRRFTKRSDAR